ncbi:CCR4-NOT transcription complex subunit 9 [Rosa chinensis]|uniref:CCR4-NOT transcription complex subunit 9 n=1 Tax=Rosa chinensis TaxID=74649 RepID=UPI001AD8F097|nr:CCR4-NOT transcription complex subunit 9 [Rosa chinensis]
MERDPRRGSNITASIANLPESLLGDQPSPPPGGGGRAFPTMPGSEFARSIYADPARREVEQLIEELNDRRTREQALQGLSKLKEVPDVALLLWHTSGLMFMLLREITGVYHLMSTPNLTQEVSNRVCNTITLFQCIASHLETRKPFIRASMPLYLYPFIGTENKDKPHEYLRLSSLGALGALVKGHPPSRDEVDPEIIHFLLESQVFCHCIRCMEVGGVLSRTRFENIYVPLNVPAHVLQVATFVVERILTTDEGLNYCCNFGDRFYVVTHVLGKMTDKLLEEPSARLLKLIIKCFLILSRGPRYAMTNEIILNS